MFLFGMVVAAIGPILPTVITQFELTNASAGALLSLLTFGILVGSLVFGPVVDRYGFKVPLGLASALVGVGLEAMAFAGGLGLLRAGVFAIGMGGGVINGATSALVADLQPERRSAGLSLLGVFFGVGALGVPLVLGLLEDRVSYQTILGTMGALAAPPLALFATLRFPAPKQPQGFPLRTGLGLLRDPVLWLFGSMLFFQSGMEITVGGWTAAYVSAELHLRAGHAAYFLSLYWLALTLGRFSLSILLRHRSPAAVLLGSMAIALAGSLALLAARAPAVAALGVFLVGAGFAGVFPIVLGFVGDRYPSVSGTAFGIALVLALCGGMAFPYATGALGDAYGLRTSLLVVPLGITGSAILFGLVRRRSPVAVAGQAVGQ